VCALDKISFFFSAPPPLAGTIISFLLLVGPSILLQERKAWRRNFGEGNYWIAYSSGRFHLDLSDA
jgi:hypothetical protein